MDGAPEDPLHRGARQESVAADLTAIFGDTPRPAGAGEREKVAKLPARRMRRGAGKAIALVLAMTMCLIVAAALLVLRPWAPRQAGAAPAVAAIHSAGDRPDMATPPPALPQPAAPTAATPSDDMIPMRTVQDAVVPEVEPKMSVAAGHRQARERPPRVADARARRRQDIARDRRPALADDAVVARAVQTVERPTAAAVPARAVLPGRCDRIDGPERKAWCMRPQILAADRQLRAAYADAGKAGVSRADLKHLQGRWATLQRQADTDPERTLQAYGEIQDTLADLVRDRRLRRGRP